MVLQIPIAIINPNLDELQNIFSQILSNVLDTHKYISMWGQDQKRKSSIKQGKFRISKTQIHYPHLFVDSQYQQETNKLTQKINKLQLLLTRICCIAKK